MQTTRRFSAAQLCAAALFAALLAVCSQLSVPLGPVPLNLALFAVELGAALLPRRAALLSVGAWLLLGLCGVPVFAGFKAGPSALFGLTGGYILGYLAAAAIISRPIPAYKESLPRLCARMAVGVLACYAFGTAWFMLLSHRGLSESLSLCVLPFLPGDAVKIFLAALLSRKLAVPLQRILPRS